MVRYNFNRLSRGMMVVLISIAGILYYLTYFDEWKVESISTKEKPQNPAQITKNISPQTNTPQASQEKSTWLEYRSNWDDQDLLVDIDPEAGILKFLPDYRPRMLTKLYHPLIKKYPLFKERLDRVNEYCNKLNIPSTETMMIKHEARMFFNDSYEFVHCVIPKASSRVWVREFAQMHNIKRPFDPEPRFNERIIFGLAYNLIPRNLTAKRIQTYTKTVVLRHPFKRILSCINDKFSHHEEFVNGINKGIIEKLYMKGMPATESEFLAAINTTYSHLDADTKMNIKFQYSRLKNGYLQKITLIELLKFIIVTWEEEGSTKSFDPHWVPISDYCLPCTFSFDILIQHDTVSVDSQLVLDYIRSNNKNNPQLNFDSFTPETSTNICNNAFKQIPIDIRKKLYDVYKHDFAMFDYKIDLSSEGKNIC